MFLFSTGDLFFSGRTGAVSLVCRGFGDEEQRQGDVAGARSFQQSQRLTVVGQSTSRCLRQRVDDVLQRRPHVGDRHLSQRRRFQKSDRPVEDFVCSKQRCQSSFSVSISTEKARAISRSNSQRKSSESGFELVVQFPFELSKISTLFKKKR